MRVFIISFIAASLALLPYGLGQFLIDTPLAIRLILLPLSEGFRYMAVAFHEAGHAATYWLFGHPALPLFDTQHGGGTTYSYGRSLALLAGIYALALSAVFLLWRAQKKRAALVIAALLPVHLFMSWQGWGGIAAAFMGHGAEGVALLWCLWRLAETKGFETYVTASLAIYLAGHVLLLTFALMFHDMRRAAYAVQKGSRGSADIDRIAALAGCSMETAAAAMTSFTLLCLGAGLFLLYSRTRKQN